MQTSVGQDFNLAKDQCAVCGKFAALKCTGCRKIVYCGKPHQKEHWPQHKKTCRLLKVCEDSVMGRFLRSTKAIKNGELILQEAPLIWGPSSDSIPVCLGCGKALNGDDDCRPCFKCGFPVCGDLCEKSPAHIPECRYTTQRGETVRIANFGAPHPLYRCITILRCLYQKQFLPKSFRKLNSLECHEEARKSTRLYESERVSIAQFMRRFFKLQHITDEEILRICGIVAVNGHELPLSDPPCIAIYANGSMFEHNCRANCAKSFTADGKIVISAARDIAEGERLSICYADPLWGTPNRRFFLQETKYFWCHCERCEDTTEFGTFFSALRCQNSPCQGLLLPATFTENKNKLADWCCDKCKRQISAYSVHDILERISKDAEELDKNSPKECLNFLHTYQPYLGDNHFYITETKYALCQNLGQENGLATLSDEDLLHKQRLCRHLREILRILAPAEKRTLGMVDFELHAALAESARRKSAIENSPEIIKAGLLDSRKFLVDAIELLKFEPEILPEGKICQQAKQNLMDLDLLVVNLENNNN